MLFEANLEAIWRFSKNCSRLSNNQPLSLALRSDHAGGTWTKRCRKSRILADASLLGGHRGYFCLQNSSEYIYIVRKISTSSPSSLRGSRVLRGSYWITLKLARPRDKNRAGLIIARINRHCRSMPRLLTNSS